ASGEFTWSDEMYHIYELDANEKIHLDKWLSYREPQEQQALLEYYDECLREKKLYDRIERISLPSGKIKMIHRKGEFVLDDSGNAIKLIGTTQDITEEYRVQQELKENQTFLRKITDATPSIISSYNVNTGQYVFISEGIEKLLGYSPAQVLDKGVLFFNEIMHPEDAQAAMQKNQEALEEANADPDNNDQVIEFTYRMKHKQGHYRWFHTYGTIFDRNNDKKVEHVLNISLDVTDQVEASKKIKEQEHFIKQIADASPTILYLYDVEAQSIVYVNREIFFVLGYMPEEIINAGSDVTQLLYHPEDYSLLPGRRQSGKTFSQVDSMIQYECRMKNKENDWRWVLVREIVFTTGENGKIKQVLGAALDINKRKEMEKTILQNTVLLEQSNASLEEFAYVASHDLKEPLRKISTFGDRLVASQGDHLSPEGKVYLNKIVDASQRMQTMINDLLSISMITGNTAFEKYSLQKIIEETMQTLEYKIEQQNAIIKADLLPEAKIIPSQFRQLFQNLLSNSLKFVKEGVQAIITVKHTILSPHDISHYQLAQAENYHKIEIADNGIGFENEFANKIFAIFQRLHGRSEYEGSGIGLAICKKIVEHHGGIIYATGAPGQGAVFTIILPAY
ncbi:MAG: PAS domain-containing sensor histidine kinase, partial [Flavisolibacter sp.]